MKNKVILSGLLLALVLATVTVNGRLSASNTTAGSWDDPAVTKSYVDDKFNQLLNMITGSSGSYSQNADSYTPVLVKYNQIVIGDEGTEIILRSGTANGYCVGSDGLVNATDGSEIVNGTRINKNNLLIVPRDDGRGARVTSDEAWFIIKGGYIILN